MVYDAAVSRHVHGPNVLQSGTERARVLATTSLVLKDKPP